MSSTTVELIFQGIDQTGAATNSALNNVKKFDDRMGKLSGSTAALGGSVNSLATSMLSFGQDVLLRSIDNAASYETALVSMKRIHEESDAPIEKVEAAVAALATQYGMTATEVMLSAVEFKKSGEEALDAVNLVEDAIRLSIAGNIDLASSSEFLKASLAGFRAEASDAPELVDLFNQAANRYNTSVEEIADGFARLSPLAADANLNFQETVGVLTPVIEVFGSGAEAANGLKTIFLRLTSDTAGVIEGLGRLGVEQRHANGEMKTGMEIYWEVAEAWQGIDDSMKPVLAGQIAGVNQAVKFSAAMNDFATTLFIASESFEYLGSAADEVDMVMETFAFRMGRNSALLEGIFSLLGRIVLEEAGNVADAVGRILDAVVQNIASGGQIKEFFELISTLIGRFASELGTFADSLPDALESADFQPFIDGVNRVADAVGGLFSNWDVTSSEGIESILTGIGNLFEFVASMAAGFISAFQKVFDVMGDADREFTFLSNEVGEFIGTFQGLMKQVTAVAGGFQNMHIIMQGLMPVLSGIGAALAVILGPKAALAAAIVGIGTAIAALNWDKLMTPLQWLADRLFGVKEDTEDFVKALEDLSKLDKTAEYLDDLNNQLGTMLESMDEFYAGVASGRFVNVNGEWEKAADYVEGYKYTVEGVSKELEAFFNEQGIGWDSSTGAIEGALSKVDDATKEVKLSIEDVDDASDQWVKTVVDGVPTFRQAGRDISAAYDDTKESAEDAIRQSKEFIMQMEELASNERIAMIEAKVTLDVAQIEADTRRVESAFESLNVGIQSTGDTMLGLFGLLSDDNLKGLDRMNLTEAIRDERKLREQEFELQKDLIESEIDLNRERAAAMARGDALIQIDGAGLAPHLEAFMWETLRAIQVRVNEDGLDMLLGAPA